MIPMPFSQYFRWGSGNSTCSAAASYRALLHVIAGPGRMPLPATRGQPLGTDPPNWGAILTGSCRSDQAATEHRAASDIVSKVTGGIGTMSTDDIVSLIALVGLTAFLGLLVAFQSTVDSTLLWSGPILLLGCAGWLGYSIYKGAHSVWTKPRS